MHLRVSVYMLWSMCVSETTFGNQFFLFIILCHWDQTQVTRLESKHLYSPSPLTGPHNFCISILFGLLVLSCGFSDVSPCSDSTSSFNSFAQIEASWPCHQIIHSSCITLCVHIYLKCIIFLCLTCSHDSAA